MSLTRMQRYNAFLHVMRNVICLSHHEINGMFDFGLDNIAALTMMTEENLSRIPMLAHATQMRIKFFMYFLHHLQVTNQFNDTLLWWFALSCDDFDAFLQSAFARQYRGKSIDDLDATVAPWYRTNKWYELQYPFEPTMSPVTMHNHTNKARSRFAIAEDIAIANKQAIASAGKRVSSPGIKFGTLQTNIQCPPFVVEPEPKSHVVFESMTDTKLETDAKSIAKEPQLESHAEFHAKGQEPQPAFNSKAESYGIESKFGPKVNAKIGIKLESEADAKLNAEFDAMEPELELQSNAEFDAETESELASKADAKLESNAEFAAEEPQLESNATFYVEVTKHDSEYDAIDDGGEEEIVLLHELCQDSDNVLPETCGTVDIWSHDIWSLNLLPTSGAQDTAYSTQSSSNETLALFHDTHVQSPPISLAATFRSTLTLWQTGSHNAPGNSTQVILSHCLWQNLLHFLWSFWIHQQDLSSCNALVQDLQDFQLDLSCYCSHGRPWSMTTTTPHPLINLLPTLPPYPHHSSFEHDTSFLHVDSLCGEILSHLFALLMMMIQSSTTLGKSITTTHMDGNATRTIMSTSITASTTIACGYGERQHGTTSTASMTIASEYGERLSITASTVISTATMATSMSIASEYEGNNDHLHPQVMTLINSMPLYWSTKRQDNIFDSAQDGLLVDPLMGIDQHQVIVNVPFSMPVIHTTSRVTSQSLTRNNNWSNDLTMMLHHVWNDLLHHLWHYNDNNKSWYMHSPIDRRLYWESFFESLSSLVALFGKFIIPVLVIMTIMSQARDQQSTPVHSMKSSANISTRIGVMETVLFMHPDLPVSWQGMHSVSNNKSKLLLDMNYHHRSVPKLAKVRVLAMLHRAHDNKLRCAQPSNSPRQDHISKEYQVVVPVLDHVDNHTDEYCLFTGSDDFVQCKDELLLSSSRYKTEHDKAKHGDCQCLRMIAQVNINTSNVTTIMYRGLFTGRPPGLSLLHVA